MIYRSEQMEEQAVLQAAAQMCAAARTAPKAKGIDEICTVVLSEKKRDPCGKMEEIGERDFEECSRLVFERCSECERCPGSGIDWCKEYRELQGALSVDLITAAPVSRKEAGVPLVMSTLA